MHHFGDIHVLNCKDCKKRTYHVFVEDEDKTHKFIGWKCTYCEHLFIVRKSAFREVSEAELNEITKDWKTILKETKGKERLVVLNRLIQMIKEKNRKATLDDVADQLKIKPATLRQQLSRLRRMEDATLADSF